MEGSNSPKASRTQLSRWRTGMAPSGFPHHLFLIWCRDRWADQLTENNACQSIFHRRILQYVARLTVQLAADSLQGGKTHGFGLARFEDREIGWGEAHTLGQFAKGDLAAGHHDIEVYYYRHIVSLRCLYYMELYRKVLLLLYLHTHGKYLREKGQEQHQSP